jgi:pyroglutamyl-peptidase
MRTVHLTCFDAFGALRENPTRWLVSALSAAPGWRVVKTELPTSYARVGGQVRRIFDERPAAVVMFGYTSQTDRLRLEQLARNRDGSPRPDNDGRLGAPVILPGGPPTYPSTVGLDPVLSALCTQEVPFTYSVDAGGYVCNHSYFLALDRAWSARPVIPCLFVHVPLLRTRAQRSEIRCGASIVLDCILRTAEPRARPDRARTTPARRRSENRASDFS